MARPPPGGSPGVQAQGCPGFLVIKSREAGGLGNHQIQRPGPPCKLTFFRAETEAEDG